MERDLTNIPDREIQLKEREEELKKLRVSDLRHQDVKGLGKRRLGEMITAESLLLEQGFDGGLPWYIATSEKSAREFEEEFGIGRHAFIAVIKHFDLPRPSREELIGRGVREKWAEPEYREKATAIHVAIWKKIHNDPEIQKRRIQNSLLANKRPEVFEKKSQAMKRKWANPEYKKRVSKSVSAAVKEKWKDPEYREKNTASIIKAMKTRVFTPEMREKISRTMKELWDDPVYREEISENIIAANNTEAVRTTKSDSMTALWQDKTYRERQTESHKKWWGDPEFGDDRREKARDNLNKTRSDPEVERRRKEGIRRAMKDPGFLARKSAKSIEVWKRSEVRDKISAAMQKHWDDPEFREKQLAVIIPALLKEEAQQKRIAGLRQRWSDPEFRAVQSEISRRTITRLNETTDQLAKAAEGIRKLRAEPDGAERFHLPTIQGYRRDIGYFAQSAWEANFARILKCQGREFYPKESFILAVSEQHQHLFKYEVTQYTVDFIVENQSCDLVVYELLAHPLEDPVGIVKAQMFKDQYPEIKLHIVNERFYLKLKRRFEKVINKSKDFCGWENGKDNLYNNPSKYTDE